MRNFYFDVLIIGAGQSGLTAGYYLRKTNLSFRFVDENARAGESWRKRYDSLRLITPDSENSLPGLILEGSKETYSAKDRYADYLERYAIYNSFPIDFNTKIVKLQKKHDYFIATAKNKIYHARNVVVATGAFQTAYIPQIAKKASSSILQIHSSEYKNPSKVPKGKVLIVGAGNSGAQIAVELAETHLVTLSSRRRIIFDSRYDFFYKIITMFSSTRLVKKIVDRLKIRKIYVPELQGLLENNKVKLVQELEAVNKTIFYFKGGLWDKFDVIVWATGFKFDFTWIKIKEAFDSNGKLLHKNGVSVTKGLYIVYPEKDYGFIRDLSTKAEYVVRHLIIHNKNS